MRTFREHLHELTAEWRNAIARHPRAVAATLWVFAVVAVGSLAGLFLFYNSLRRGLPGEVARDDREHQQEGDDLIPDHGAMVRDAEMAPRDIAGPNAQHECEHEQPN